MGVLNFKKGYKYRLTEDYVHQLGQDFVLKVEEIETPYVWLGEDGTLILKKGYTTDGPSGPTVDTNTFMRGAFVHDALYQLIRLGLLDKNTFRKAADKTLYRVCREDGMFWVRAVYVYWGVRVFGNKNATNRKSKPVISVAPKNVTDTTNN